MKRSLLVSAALLSGIAAAQTYCIPQATGMSCAAADEYIANVTVSNLNNNSLCPAIPAYEDFTGSVAGVVLTPGQTYPISVTIGNAWSTDRVYIMLDVNGDGLWQTVGAGSELLATFGPLVSGTGGGPQTLTGSITIPPSTLASSRLRLRLSYGALTAGNEGCVNATFGNCEDYTALLATGPVTPEYQVNQLNATHDFDGVAGGAFAPAQVTRCENTTFNVNLGSPLVGNPFDVLLSPIALLPVSGGALWTGNQSVNINLASFVWAFGGFVTPFFGSVSLPVSLPSATDIYTQMAIIDPSHLDGVSISQPNGLHIVAGAGLAGYVPPTGDDAANMLPSPACLSFYGQTRNSAWVSTNGRVGFGSTMNTGFTPSAATAMTGDASINYWTDLNVIAPASIVASNPAAGITRIQWNNVIYYATAITNNFGIQIDNTTNSVQIDSLAGGFAADVGQALLGISNGTSGSSDPGSINFGGLVLGSGTAAPNPGMIYNLGARGTALGGYTSVIFIWNPILGNYDWAAF